eukprot:gnl/TRDRNA2_/TRDRNA2_164280_c1_seq1.p1 gnl/TRDRNA2_/TRDRNA2_164280_c1~~gnl/TRDRNA2_/TRDRNA2_164280_c1_seq1.p1  ORF type:complete len:319 (+),score=40.83 gnl/TRDRNA2_/TRDRNA2_164280_c1_seq1:105-959(+)
MYTDVHAGPITGRSKLEGLLQETLKLTCNVMLLNGDMCDGFVAEREEMMNTLRPLSTAFPDGGFYTLGNHEYYNYNEPRGGAGSAENWASYWNANGFTALVNSHVDLPLKGAKLFTLAGIDDNLGNPDVQAALANRTNSDLPIVLAAHQPWPHADNAAGHGISAVLSGHTHGGQVYPVQLGASHSAGGYLSGHYVTAGNVHVYVGDGTVSSEETMVRFFTRSEITQVVLRSNDPENYGMREAGVGLMLCYVLMFTGCLACISHLGLCAWIRVAKKYVSRGTTPV